jgi:hypothetical protein
MLQMSVIGLSSALLNIIQSVILLRVILHSAIFLESVVLRIDAFGY